MSLELKVKWPAPLPSSSTPSSLALSKKPLRRSRPRTAAAYDVYLRAVAIDNALTLDTTKRVADLYAEAVRLDPQFALAWARLAVARSQLYFNGLDLERNSGAAVKEAADLATSLQPELGEAWLAQGVYRYRVLRDFQGALQSGPRGAQAFAKQCIRASADGSP